MFDESNLQNLRNAVNYIEKFTTNITITYEFVVKASKEHLNFFLKETKIIKIIHKS